MNDQEMNTKFLLPLQTAKITHFHLCADGFNVSSIHCIAYGIDNNQ